MGIRGLTFNDPDRPIASELDLFAELLAEGESVPAAARAAGLPAAAGKAMLEALEEDFGHPDSYGPRSRGF